jgi:hypothetical protein
VKVDLTLVSISDVDAAKANFMLCPMLMNWMMWASWYAAYPMGPSGAWKNLGGDFDSSTCITTPTVTGQTLQFDVTTWVTNYVIGRNQNYGRPDFVFNIKWSDSN